MDIKVKAKEVLLGAAVGAVAYFSTLFVAANAPSVPRMTADALKELDELDIADVEYDKSYEEVGKVVDCKVKTLQGVIEAKAYFVAGDEKSAEWNDGMVKITIPESEVK